MDTGMMKSMALTGIAEMDMISEPEPVLSEDNDVLVRVSHMGVCGSDMHYYSTGRIGSLRLLPVGLLDKPGQGKVHLV